MPEPIERRRRLHALVLELGTFHDFGEVLEAVLKQAHGLLQELVVPRLDKIPAQHRTGFQLLQVLGRLVVVRHQHPARHLAEVAFH
ncbi:hypothetical protein D3C81_1900540 [compost metagenome]